MVTRQNLSSSLVDLLVDLVPRTSFANDFEGADKTFSAPQQLVCILWRRGSDSHDFLFNVEKTCTRKKCTLKDTPIDY